MGEKKYGLGPYGHCPCWETASNAQSTGKNGRSCKCYGKRSQNVYHSITEGRSCLVIWQSFHYLKKGTPVLESV